MANGDSTRISRAKSQIELARSQGRAMTGSEFIWPSKREAVRQLARQSQPKMNGSRNGSVWATAEREQKRRQGGVGGRGMVR